MKPLILINFKAYLTGKEAIKLAKTLSGFKSNYQMAVSPQVTDLREIGKSYLVSIN